MPERSELSKAIVAAADREFSTFKDTISGALEQRFKDKINAISKEKASKMFNPEYEPENTEAGDDNTDDELNDDELNDDELNDDKDDSTDDLDDDGADDENDDHEDDDHEDEKED